MIMKHLLSLLIFCSSVCSIYALNIDDINIRDPFILNDGNRYYMYCTKDTLDANGCIRGGVVVYTSTNLKEWKGPSRVLTIPDSNALKGSVWAPEVHKYKGRYYLFATITSDLKWKKSTEGWPEYTFRGTQVFHSDSPYGPFVPFGKYPHTQLDYMALDGTLWVENNVPYMVYCHEWVQLHGDGTMELVELSEDLSQTIGTPMVLFNGSAPEWSDGLMISQGLPKGYITDGCYLYRTKNRTSADDLVEFQPWQLCYRHIGIHYRLGQRTLETSRYTAVSGQRRAWHDFQNNRWPTVPGSSPAQQPVRG